MRPAVDPRQGNLFDPAERMFSPMTLKLIRQDWPGLFRAQMLHLMPAEALGKKFHETLGCPTKELYGMAGTIFLKEFFNLTIAQMVERYLKLFEENDLARTIFDRVTASLVETLELNVSKQRLDSTHIFSAMAMFGRTKLMAGAIKRFLVQLKRHHASWYMELPEEFRDRYAPAQAKLFGDFKGERTVLRQRVAEDLLFVVSRFAPNAAVTARTSYNAMARILSEQCDVVEERVTLKAKPGGNVMQNPSEPDATYDGHKGPGYQAQLAETCHEANDVQLITGVITEPAHCPDPANSEALTVDDFAVDETTETVECCPNGCVPVSSVHDAETGVTTTVMNGEDCVRCAFRSQCPVKEIRGAPRVSLAVLLRCAGWNFLCALRALKKREIGDFLASFGRSYAWLRLSRFTADRFRRFFRPEIATEGIWGRFVRVTGIFPCPVVA